MNANNTVVLIGRVATQPEIKYINTTKKMYFRLAVKKSFSSQNQNSDAYFIPIAVWGNRTIGLEKLIASGVFGKGALVSIVGELRVESYEDRHGIRRIGIEVAADNVKVLAPVGNANIMRDNASFEDDEVISKLGEIDKDIDALDSFDETVPGTADVSEIVDSNEFSDEFDEDSTFDDDVLP